MTTFNSTYNATKSNLGFEAEINRLKAQALMGWDKEFRNLKWFGLKDGMKVLEVGCGPGFITEKLVEKLPNSSITALDVDKNMLIKAKQLFERIPKANVEFIQSTVYDTGLSNNEYDFVIARLVFLHLFEPEKAALEILRILKPGGKLVIIDIDDGMFGIIQPDIENFHVIMNKLINLQKKAGGNRQIGRSLPRLLESSGFTNVDIDAVTIHSDLVGLGGFKEQYNPMRFERFYKEGILTEDEFKSIKMGFENLLSDPNSYTMMNLLLACGTRPFL